MIGYNYDPSLVGRKFVFRLQPFLKITTKLSLTTGWLCWLICSLYFNPKDSLQISERALSKLVDQPMPSKTRSRRCFLVAIVFPNANMLIPDVLLKTSS